jgi:hypothetical protein
MRKFIVILLLLFFCISSAKSQAGDFIVIRKNNQNIRTFLKGSLIRFITKAGEPIESKILDIRHDSLFFKEVILQRVGTPWGVGRLDTVATPIRQIHYTEIGAVPRKNEAFSYIKNGSLLMIGSGGYIILNVINGAYMHYPPLGKKNRPGLLAAASVFAVGFLQSKLHKPYLEIGKKYSVEYIKLNSTKP